MIIRFKSLHLATCTALTLLLASAAPVPAQAAKAVKVQKIAGDPQNLGEFANFGQDPSESERSTVRYLEPVLKAMDIRSWRLETASDMPKFDEAFRYAWGESRPAALLVGAPTGWN